MVVGVDDQLSCTAGYSSSKTDFLLPGQVPQIEATLNGLQLSGDFIRKDAGQGEISSLTLASDGHPNIFNYTNQRFGVAKGLSVALLRVWLIFVGGMPGTPTQVGL